MAKIVIDFLKNVDDNRNNTSVYTDLKMDLQLNRTYSDQLEKKQQIADIQVDNNEGAIKNSVVSIITTSPGEKILNPLFGCNFGDLLFLPVTEQRARLVGETILNAISKFEPRVRVVNINVTPLFDEFQYVISFTLVIPRFKTQQIAFKGTLDKSGFFVNNQ
jgi:phage baseplate assembly protein W